MDKLSQVSCKNYFEFSPTETQENSAPHVSQTSLSRQPQSYLGTCYWLMWEANVKVSFEVFVWAWYWLVGLKEMWLIEDSIYFIWGTEGYFLRASHPRQDEDFRAISCLCCYMTRCTSPIPLLRILSQKHFRFIFLDGGHLRSRSKSLSLPPWCDWLACGKHHCTGAYWHDYWRTGRKKGAARFSLSSPQEPSPALPSH